MSGPAGALGHGVRIDLEQPCITDLRESTRCPPPDRAGRRGYPRLSGAAGRPTGLNRSSLRPTRSQRLAVSAGERSTRTGVDSPVCEIPRDNIDIYGRMRTGLTGDFRSRYFVAVSILVGCL